MSGCLLFLVPIAACGNGDDGGDARPPAAANTSGPRALKGVCPDPIVIQKDWQPESEQGHLYQLVGPGYTIDSDKKRVIGPLVAHGVDTGVRIEIRSGGPAIGFQSSPAVMYLDKSIHLGQVPTDVAVESAAAGQPTTAVVAPLEVSPVAILWDPQQFPQFKTIADIGKTDTKVLYTEGFTFMEYLVGTGQLRRDQLDGSYTGAPDLFVGTYGGKAALQGFATSEPYLYEHEIKQWGKPLTFQLLNDTGYVIYIDPLAVRSAEKATLAPCLEKLVPIIQQAVIDFMERPEPALDIIVEAARQYQTGWQYSENLARYSVQAMRDLGIVGDGPDQTLGNFDLSRTQRIIDILRPILAQRRQPLKVDLSPADIVTNEFVDPKISLAGR
jgi:hypothetical protein